MWPPPPHDPTERVAMVDAHGWEVRMFARNDPKHLYFAPRGMLHLQLWHAENGTSVLTPSKLTAGAIEVWHAGERRRFVHAGCYARYLASIDLRPPCPRWVHQLEAWLLHAHAIGAVPRSGAALPAEC